MLRKVAALLAVVGLLAGAAVAYAQSQVNTYTVTGGHKPLKPGTKKHPKPVGIKFDYTVGEKSGLRPATVKRYTIGFYGGFDNGQFFKKCTAKKINAAGDDSVCSKKAIVGKGAVHNEAGNSNDPTNTSLKCNLGLTIYNAGKHKAALFLHGAPPDCVVTISQAIDAKYVKAFGGKGTALQFDVPSTLLHPLNGIDNAVTDVESKLPKKTTKVHGRKRGYFESAGKCKHHKAPIQVTFVTEAGQKSTVRHNSPC